jgi:hypothetical protein
VLHAPQQAALEKRAAAAAATSAGATLSEWGRLFKTNSNGRTGGGASVVAAATAAAAVTAAAAATADGGTVGRMSSTVALPAEIYAGFDEAGTDALDGQDDEDAAEQCDTLLPVTRRSMREPSFLSQIRRASGIMRHRSATVGGASVQHVPPAAASAAAASPAAASPAAASAAAASPAAASAAAASAAAAVHRGGSLNKGEAAAASVQLQNTQRTRSATTPGEQTIATDGAVGGTAAACAVAPPRQCPRGPSFSYQRALLQLPRAASRTSPFATATAAAGGAAATPVMAAATGTGSLQQQQQQQHIQHDVSTTAGTRAAAAAAAAAVMGEQLTGALPIDALSNNNNGVQGALRNSWKLRAQKSFIMAAMQEQVHN